MTQDNKPLSKEEILNRHLGDYAKNTDDRRLRFVGIHILSAMDEYAKQEAIGFAKLLRETGVINFVVNESDEELYSLYLKSKENIEP